jgi:outer membrane murein-binding lipoprotein Lpp
MVGKLFVFSLLFILVMSLSGCATQQRQKDLQMQGLRNQVAALESQIQLKDDEIYSLKEELAKAETQGESAIPARQVNKKKVVGEVKSRPSVKQIQIALQNAGYNPGAIDGKMGRQTREAIKDFQRANNLAADGKAGKNTWGLLGDYLYKKVK